MINYVYVKSHCICCGEYCGIISFSLDSPRSPIPESVGTWCGKDECQEYKETSHLRYKQRMARKWIYSSPDGRS